jgi:hypothetical protein
MDLKDAVYAGGILVTLLLGIWNLIANYRSTRRTNFINVVTSQRIKWIEQLRQDISSYIACFTNVQGASIPSEVTREMNRLCHVIRLRLNPDGTQDRKIELLINEIPTLTDSSRRKDLFKALNELTVTSQKLLKEEWEKVKHEAEYGNLNSDEDLGLNPCSAGW